MVLRRMWILILLMLVCSVGPASAALFGGENRVYKAATEAFNDGFWDRAEEQLDQFITKYPKSERVPEAVLLEAEAQLKQGKFASAIALLAARKGGAGKFADEYVYWLGETQFESTNYAAAADTFAVLVRDFPESSRRLEAVVSEAAARAKLNDWPCVVELLQQTNGAFQNAANKNPSSELAVRGRLLLGEALLTQKDFAGAEAALRPLEGLQFKPELDWQRQYLLCRIQLAANRPADALAGSSNLLAVAESAGQRDLLAESVAFRAGIFEKLNQRDEAITVLGRNLETNAPVAWQRSAMLKMTELALAQNQPAEATRLIETFLNQQTNAPATDAALLTLGELHLKQYLTRVENNRAANIATNTPSVTNHLEQALALFDQLVTAYPTSAFVGKAELNRGWCFWVVTNVPESAAAFGAAVARLSPSEDLVVARFKLGDALFLQTNYAGALQNYRVVTDELRRWPRLQQAIGDQALYQTLRAALELKDVTSASNAMAQTLQSNPHSTLADRSVLLVGEGLAGINEPVRARNVFKQFLELSPDATLRPDVELAIARTYEQQAEWAAAITNYDGWLDRFATNDLRPRAEFCRAWANFEAGNETNVFVQFTNFVAQFPTNELAPRAQWWVADYYFRLGDFVNAEKNYQLLFQTWPASDLALQARMMAGRAAVGRLGYSDARDYFTNLTSDLNCPPGLKVQALFAYGDVLVHMEPTDTNAPLANVEEAIRVFGKICQLYPTNEACALAWGEIGNCYLQLATRDARQYEAATNAYWQVVNLPRASIATRSQAQVGIGLALEKSAQRKTEEEQTTLLKLALGNYLDVAYQKNLREGESPDLFWVKKAGLEAARVAESLGEWTQAMNMYRRLEVLLPPLKEMLEKKIAKAQEYLEQRKN